MPPFPVHESDDMHVPNMTRSVLAVEKVVHSLHEAEVYNLSIGDFY
jgi:hypothetical protein